jgi:3-dehydroquinate synthetase
MTTPGGTRAARSAGVVVGLKVPSAELAARLSASGPGEDRPLLPGKTAADLDALLAARRVAYASVDAEVDAVGTPAEVAARVDAATAGLEVLEAEVGESRTRILVGRGLVRALVGAVVGLRPERPVLLLTDGGVPEARRAAARDALAEHVELVEVPLPGGEDVKTWEVLGRTLERALAAGCGRQSVVVGLGGGAVCDLAGLAASLLGRGAPLVLVPTTLLAQVDASVGGKCAVNARAGRNLIGAFAAAREVVTDLDLLESLEPRDARAGLAELLKIAVIADPSLFDEVVRAGRADVSTVARALRLKAAVVRRDPFERGERRTLNLGHTLGHALESASDFALRHGEAVAIGMAAVARLSTERGWLAAGVRDHILGGLAAVGLPTSAPAELLARATPFLGADKKASRDHVHLVVIRGMGETAVETLSWREVGADLVRLGGVR